MPPEWAAFFLIESISVKRGSRSRMANPQMVWRRALRAAERKGVHVVFESMLELNIRFIQGELSETPSILGPLDEESAPLVPALLELNSLGMFTTNSQPGLEEDGLRQRSWISGLIPVDIAGKVEWLFSQRDDGVFAMMGEVVAVDEECGPLSNRVVVTTDQGEPYTRVGWNEDLSYLLGYNTLRTTTLTELASNLMWLSVIDSVWGRQTTAIDAVLEVLRSVV